MHRVGLGWAGLVYGAHVEGAEPWKVCVYVGGGRRLAGYVRTYIHTYIRTVAFTHTIVRERLARRASILVVSQSEDIHGGLEEGGTGGRGGDLVLHAAVCGVGDGERGGGVEYGGVVCGCGGGAVLLGGVGVSSFVESAAAFATGAGEYLHALLHEVRYHACRANTVRMPIFWLETGGGFSKSRVESLRGIGSIRWRMMGLFIIGGCSMSRGLWLPIRRRWRRF